MKRPLQIVVIVGSAVIAAIIVWAALPGSDHDIMVAEGTLVLALVTYWLVVVAFSEMREGQKRAEESKRASFRPLVIPVGSLGLNQRSDEAAFWDVNAAHKIEVRNVGNGVATNVQAVLLPRRDWGDTSKVFSMWLSHPLAKGEEAGGHFTSGAILIVPGDHIRNVLLHAPVTTPPFHFFRLSLTYWDILGLKHASIFDLTKDGVWEQVNILPEIPQDLHDIDAANQSVRGWSSRTRSGN